MKEDSEIKREVDRKADFDNSGLGDEIMRPWTHAGLASRHRIG